MAQKTFNTDNVRDTANKFSQQRDQFSQIVTALTSTIEQYISENQNDAGRSVSQEWDGAKPHLQKVSDYFDKFNQGLQKQAQILDETEQGLKWQ